MNACKPKIMLSEPYLTMNVGKASKEKYQKLMDCFVKWLFAALKG